MTLPKLETNRYSVVVPSTQKTIEFRPFLVREEKLLMVAQESEDTSQMLKVLCDIIEVCTFNSLKGKDLTIYDLEYIFLQLRSKSVGETTEVSLKCKECGHDNVVDIDLSKIDVRFPDKAPSNKLQLNDDVGITLRSITVGKTIEIAKIQDENEGFIASIAACIETIYDKESVYLTDDSSQKELHEFIGSLSHSHLGEIQEFITNQPVLNQEINYKCASCGHESTYVLEGLMSFF